jgi:hypothetical protein
MDFFLALCQALGLGLAAGVLAGAVIRTGSPPALLAVGALAGAAVGALSMSADDESVVLGVLVGLAGGLVAALAAGGLVGGAVRRADAGSGAAIPAIVALLAGLLAGLSILLPPVSLVALAALMWLVGARRRRAARKHEGLRILR